MILKTDARIQATAPMRGVQKTAAPVRASASARTLGARVRAWLGASQGGALVEFAMVLPMMLVVVTGMFSFGIALNNQLELTQAVGAGAQFLQAARTSTTDPCATALAAIESAAPNLKSSNLSLTLTMSGTSVQGSSCSGDQVDLVQGGSVTVLATYPCNLFVYGLNLGTGCQLSAQVTEYEY